MVHSFIFYWNFKSIRRNKLLRPTSNYPKTQYVRLLSLGKIFVITQRKYPSKTQNNA